MTSQFKLIIATITLGFTCSYSYSDTLWTGAWSHHSGAKYDYNEQHDLIAYWHDSGFGAAKFENSYYKTSYFAGYRWTLAECKYAKLSFVAGGVTGYEDITYQWNGIGPYALFSTEFLPQSPFGIVWNTVGKVNTLGFSWRF